MATITLTNNETGEKFDFDLIECKRGPKAVDFSKLFERTNMAQLLGVNQLLVTLMAKKVSCSIKVCLLQTL